MRRAVTNAGTRFLAAVLVASLLVASAALAWWRFGRAPAFTMDTTDVRVLAKGEAIYVERCASCHGEKLEGQRNWRVRLPNGRMPAPPHDATGHTWHHPSAVLFGIVSEGVTKFAPPGYESDMPAFGDVLSDDEIRAVLAYIRSRWPEEVRQRHDEIERRARAQ